MVWSSWAPTKASSETRPSPPGRFSTTTGLPQRADKRSANRRAVVSLALPAPYGRMKCTARAGNTGCAAAPLMICKLAARTRAANAMTWTIEAPAARAVFSSYRNRGLPVFEIPILTRPHRGIFGLARRGNAFDERVVVGLLKEGDGQALCARGDRCRRVYHPVRVGNPAVVGPAHKQVADIDDKG